MKNLSQEERLLRQALLRAAEADDAQRLAGMIRDKHGVEVKLITYTGTVIGAHSGPGTLALFFLGKHR